MEAHKGLKAVLCVQFKNNYNVCFGRQLMGLEGFSGSSRSTSVMDLFRFQIQGDAALDLRMGLYILVLLSSNVLSSELNASEPSFDQINDKGPIITKLEPERESGRGFKLEYTVSGPPEVLWGFKTNFDSDLLHKNKFINSHKLVSHEKNLVVTENVYSYKPRSVFKWQTIVLPEQKILKYELLNPEECGQKYHYGTIRLEAEGSSTRVTHVAYFDFFGVSLWVNYPFKGGMSEFLKYTARWEQEFVSEYGTQYQNELDEPG